MKFLFARNIAKSRIGRKLITAIIMFSSLITLVTTAFQLTMDYQQDVKSIHNEIQAIRLSQLETLRHSLWLFDGETTQILLKSLLKTGSVEYLKVSTMGGESWKAGNVRSKNTITTVFPIYYSPAEEKRIGELEIVSGLDSVYRHLFERALIILFSNIIKTFLVAIFAILVFQKLVSRHLHTISSYVNQMGDDIHGNGIFLKNKKTDAKYPDEIDQIVTAINLMRIKQRDSVDELLKQKILLQKANKRLRSYFDQSLIGTTITSVEKGFLEINDRLCEILGYSRKELMQKTWEEITHPSDLPADVESFNLLLENKTKNYTLEKRFIRGNGEFVHTKIFVSCERDSDGSVKYVVALVEDISEQKEMEQQLRQSQKMESIGKLAGGIAHDFNNILYPIIGFTQLSIEDLPGDHPVQENLKDVIIGAKRASDLVKKILLFSRQKEPILKPIILRPVIEETLKLLRSTIPSNINIKSRFYEDEDLVLCDVTEIHEIVMNLCTNSYHSMEKKGDTIKLCLDKVSLDKVSLDKVNLDKKRLPDNLNLSPGEYVCLSVSDNGTGIKPELIERIFEPYYTTKEIGKGSGLGLSVVHGIVKSYKGDIQVESRLQKGSVFNVFLPITSKLREPKFEIQTQKIHSGNEKILFVDDEKAIIKLGKKALERQGYKVTGLQDSLEALEIFKSNPQGYDLIISDMAMPAMEGTELANKIFEIRPDIPIILCTGYSKKLDTQKVKAQNIKAFVDKPILIDNLLKKIREILDQNNGHDIEDSGNRR